MQQKLIQRTGDVYNFVQSLLLVAWFLRMHAVLVVPFAAQPIAAQPFAAQPAAAQPAAVAVAAQQLPNDEANVLARASVALHLRSAGRLPLQVR